MADPTLAQLRAHVAWQLDRQLPREGSKRVVSALLVLLDASGLLDVAPLLEVAAEHLEAALDEDPTSKRAALLAGLSFMAGGEQSAALEAFGRLLGEDLSHERRVELADQVNRIDRALQHVGLLKRDLLDAARGDSSLRDLAELLDGDADARRTAAQEATRRGVNVRSATRVVAFLDEPAPRYERGDTLVSTLLVNAASAWRAGNLAKAKACFDRALARDVRHEERDVVVALVGSLLSRTISPLAAAREARRELVLETVAKLTAMPTAEVRHVLALMHRCDPVAVGARDFAELVRLQLAWHGRAHELCELADRAIDEFAKDVDYPSLSDRFGRSVTDLKRAREEFLAFQRTPIERLVLGVDEHSSDLAFEREGPDLSVRAGARGAVPASPSPELLRLARALLPRVAEFMRYGVERLVPVSTASLAHEAGLTVSQVERLVEDVLVATPWGIVAMNHFVQRAPRVPGAPPR